MAKQWTHQQLVEKSAKWLQKPLGAGGAGCHISITEFPTGWLGEIPDAIGWRATSEALGGSVLCEVKISRSDFLADKKKPHRNGDQLGVGNHRFYVAPAGLIDVSELPLNWGLVEITERGAAKCVAGYPKTTHNGNRNTMFRDTWFTADTDREMNILVRLLSRLGNIEELNNIKRENRRLLSQNKALKAQAEKVELADYMKEFEKIESSPIPIQRQLQRKRNQIRQRGNQ